MIGKTIHYAFVLGIICLAAALGVAGTFKVTRPLIQTREQAAQSAAQTAVIRGGNEAIQFRLVRDTALLAQEIQHEGKSITMAEAVAAMEEKKLPADEIDRWIKGATKLPYVLSAEVDGELVGYAALGAARGYGGPVRVMIGMDPAATKISGITIVQQTETPGLGTRVADVESNRTWVSMVTGQTEGGTSDPVPLFLKQIIGKSPGQIELKRGSVQAITGATISSRAVVNAARQAADRIVQAAGERIRRANGGAPGA